MKREALLARMGMRLPRETQIRVYDFVDVCMILKDTNAKLSLCNA